MFEYERILQKMEYVGYVRSYFAVTVMNDGLDEFGVSFDGLDWVGAAKTNGQTSNSDLCD